MLFLLKINSKYILSQIFDILMMPKTLNIIRYNREIQKKLKRKLLDYKNEYEKIVIEIIPKDNEYGNFINFSVPIYNIISHPLFIIY